ncbi:hypothetical protein QWY84_18470 [Aquisalimonas lutea]|uniref:hypothetical protein n=1 Tax=Aquisalimonas lutea TaxID=1327750 RepID=UPI0025B2A0BD|nr:hypothetical protein [Aquisalimonas lutea]MDN3519597.1 hypothetical protein [Aquisalimonas lutea]
MAQLLGKEDDPEADYSVAVVDLQQSNLREEASTFVPTNRNMAAFAKQEISYIDPHRVDEVMTDRYAQRYGEARSAMDEVRNDGNSSCETNDFRSAYFDSDTEREKSRRFPGRRKPVHVAGGALGLYGECRIRALRRVKRKGPGSRGERPGPRLTTRGWVVAPAQGGAGSAGHWRTD